MMTDFLFWAAATPEDPDRVSRLVLLLIPLILLPLLIPAALGRIYPTRQMPAVFLVPMFISLGLVFVPDLFPVVLALDGILILIVLGDLFSLPIFRCPFQVERTTERIVSLTHSHLVKLRVKNRSFRDYKIAVSDDLPEVFQAEKRLLHERMLPERSVEELEYDFHATARGLFSMEFVTIRVTSLFRFWIRDFQIPCKSDLWVYPNLEQINQYDLLARTDRLYQLGVRTVRRVGYDNDFERLRDYQLDDQFKFIDWSATARRNKLTVKDFQTSRCQRVIFMLDCGRMMTNESEDGLSLLDHSLNAMLMLGYVALRQADEVGMLAFSNRILNYVPVASGQRQMNRMLHGCFDLFPEHVESRYDDAFAYLSTRCRKRALVILVTNVTDQVNANRIERHLKNLSGKHLPFGVFLRDHRIFDAVSRNADGHEADDSEYKDFWESGAAAQILNWRHQVITDIKHQGTLTLDVFPEEMTAPLINRYLEIKARQLL